MKIPRKQIVANLRRMLDHRDAFADRSANTGVELDAILALLSDDASPELAAYEYINLLGVGSHGFVLQVEHKRLGRCAAVVHCPGYIGTSSKWNYQPSKEAVKRLLSASHPNLVRVHDFFTVGNGRVACMVLHLIPSAKTVDTWLQDLCQHPKPATVDSGKDATLVKIADRLVRLLYKVSDALEYFHATLKLVHADVKPANILVDEFDNPAVSDFLGALPKLQSGVDVHVPIAYTPRYAHPMLLRGKALETVASTSSTLTGDIDVRSIDLRDVIDVYAFGKSVLELLGILTNHFGVAAERNYEWRFLHMVASLCLDGFSARETMSRQSNFDRSVSEDIGQSALKYHAFRSFADVRAALGRLLTPTDILQNVPELDPWYKTRIPVFPDSFLPLTPRVRSLVEHPLVERLHRISTRPYLRMVSSVPSRSCFARLLGVLKTTSDIILSLYFDSDNPLFRVLIDKRLIEQLLVAAVLRELTTFATEGFVPALKAEMLSDRSLLDFILRADGSRDERGRRLIDVLTGTNADEWGLPEETVELSVGVWGEHRLSKLLHDILDGPFGARRLDQVMREPDAANFSVLARGMYADVLRGLTVTYTNPEHSNRSDLRVVQKSTQMEPILAMLSLWREYAHQTARGATQLSVRAMLNAALSEQAADATRVGLKHGSSIVKLFARTFLLGDKPHIGQCRSTRRNKAPAFGERGTNAKESENDLQELWTEILANTRTQHLPYDIEELELVFFSYFSGEKARRMIADVVDGKFYTPLLQDDSLAIGSDTDRVLYSITRRNQWHVCAEVAESLRGHIESVLRSQSSDRATDTPRMVDEIFSDRMPIIIDVQEDRLSGLTSMLRESVSPEPDPRNSTRAIVPPRIQVFASGGLVAILNDIVDAHGLKEIMSKIITDAVRRVHF